MAALAFWVVWCGFHTLQKVVDYYTPLPMWDYWRVVDHLNDYRSFHWAVFWQQHNEHRIVFPEIVFALDMLLLHGRMLLPLLLSVLSYIGTWLVLSSTLLSELSIPAFTRVVAVLISGIVALWEGVAGVLAIPFLLNWTLMQLAAAIALVSASKLHSRDSGTPLAAAIAACVVASYSSGNGLLLWPIVIVLAVVMGARRRAILALSGAAVATVGLYLFDFRLTDESKIRSLRTAPLYTIQYVASYLSMPFGAMKTPTFGVKLGLWLCITVLVLFVVAGVTRRLTSHPSAVLFSYFSFTLLTAILTAGGRMDSSDPRFAAAHAFRYVSVPQMNWSASILLAFSVLGGLHVIRKYLAVVAAGIILLLWNAFPKLSPWLGGLASFFAEQQVATLTVESGLHETRWIEAKIFPNAAFVDARLARLKQEGLSIYHGGSTQHLGRPVRAMGSVSAEARIPGMVVGVTPVESGFEIQGWADRSGRNMPSLSLVFADESGAIVGFGRQFPGGLPAVLVSPEIPASLAWVGFVSGRSGARVISAYVQVPGGNVLYPLGEPTKLQSAESIRATGASGSR